MNNDIRTVIQRILNIRAHKGIVNDNLDSLRMSDICNLSDIDKTESRVGRRLNPHKLCLRLDQGLEVGVNGRSKGDIDVMSFCDFSEVSMGAAVDI